MEQLSGNDKIEYLREDLSTLSMELGVEESVLVEISNLKSRIAELESLQFQMKEGEKKSYCPTDPDARLMKSRDRHIDA